MNSSIFFDVHLPNAATWFYFSGLLAVALFFKFTRLVSLRNLDIPALYLLMPGMLLLLEDGRQWWGYFWLFCGSGYFLARCLFDLVLVRRPALAPNLSPAGLLWLGGTLFLSLIIVPWLPTEGTTNAEAPPSPIGGVQKEIETQVQKHGVAPSYGPPLTVWVQRTLALLCHASIAAGMVLIGWRHFDDVHAGIGAATFYLLLPYTFLLMPATALGVGSWQQVWPMALMIWSVFCYRRPLLAGCFLGLAAGSVLFPVLTLPVWLSFYWRRGSLRFALSFVLSAGLCLAVIMFLRNEWPQMLPADWGLDSWQPWRESPEDTLGFWKPSDWAYRIPVFVVYLTFVLGTLFWPSPKNLAQVLALASAVLIGIQFWYADRGGVHILWYLPFFLLLVFRPNLSNCQATRPRSDDLPARLYRWLLHLPARWFKTPEPAAPVS